MSLPPLSDLVPFAGDSLERSYFFYDRPSTLSSNAPAFRDNHGWVVSAVRTGCALGHRATTIRACAHLIKTAARYQLRAQGRYFVPEPNMFGGVAGRSPGERPHDVIAGESSRTFPAKRDPVWTQGTVHSNLTSLFCSSIINTSAVFCRTRHIFSTSLLPLYGSCIHNEVLDPL